MLSETLREGGNESQHQQKNLLHLCWLPMRSSGDDGNLAIPVQRPHGHSRKHAVVTNVGGGENINEQLETHNRDVSPSSLSVFTVRKV